MGKYNLDYNNLYQEEIDLLDYITSIVLKYKDNPLNINCIDILNYITDNKDINGFDIIKRDDKKTEYDINHVFIVNDEYELEIISSEYMFLFLYIRYNYNNHKTNEITQSDFNIIYINKNNGENIHLDNDMTEEYYISIRDHEFKESIDRCIVMSEIYDLNKIKLN